MARRSTKRRDEAHVRLYRHELESPAYRSLSTDARALLVEFRALFTGRENRLFMSVREAAKRIGVSEKTAQKALKALIDRGFIRCIEQGGFARKVKHASVYALECQPDNPLAEGATAPKTFMKWQPPEENAVGKFPTVRGRISHSEREKSPKKAPTVGEIPTVNGNFKGSTVGEIPTQIVYQGGVAASSDPFMLTTARWATNRVAMPAKCTGRILGRVIQ